MRVVLQTAQIGQDLNTNHGGAARAFVASGFRTGDILSIDRSIQQMPRKYSSGTTPWSTSDIKGGWDYCESFSAYAGTAYSQQIDGLKHAVRVCLRRGGALQCTNSWWVDMNG